MQVHKVKNIVGHTPFSLSCPVLAGLCLCLCCWACKPKSPTQDAKQHTPTTNQQAEDPTAENTQTYTLDNGLTIKVYDKNIAVSTKTGKQYLNKHIIRQPDEQEDCPSEGFMDIVHKAPYFTIEQQNCSGWMLINEYISFKYIPETDDIHLHRFGLQYIDRRHPDKEIPEKVMTQKDFGVRSFEEVKMEELYALVRE